MIPVSSQRLDTFIVLHPASPLIVLLLLFLHGLSPHLLPQKIPQVVPISILRLDILVHIQEVQLPVLVQLLFPFDELLSEPLVHEFGVLPLHKRLLHLLVQLVPQLPFAFHLLMPLLLLQGLLFKVLHQKYLSLSLVISEDGVLHHLLVEGGHSEAFILDGPLFPPALIPLSDFVHVLLLLLPLVIFDKAPVYLESKASLLLPHCISNFVLFI